MAKKATLEVLIKDKLEPFQGYEYNHILGLFLLDGRWRCVHLATGICIAGLKDNFKQKRDCLEFIERLYKENINWSFKTMQGAVDINPEFGVIYERCCK